MDFDGARADAELLGDVAIVQPDHDQLRDRALALGQERPRLLPSRPVLHRRRPRLLQFECSLDRREETRVVETRILDEAPL